MEWYFSMVEQSKIGVGQNDAVLVASINDASVVGGTGWATNVADSALWKHENRIVVSQHTILETW